MVLKISGLHRFGVQATFLLLAACSNSPQKENVAESEVLVQTGYFVGDKAVYANLVSASGGSWIFESISESDAPPKKGFLVRLNDLAPVLDTRVAECTPQTYPANHKCSPTHPFRDKNLGVLGKIINGGIAASTAGAVTEVSRTYETSFDETAFNQAVDEALINSGLDQGRQDLLQALATYDSLASSSQARLTELQQQTETHYRNTAAIQLDIRPQFTGLTQYYTDDIDFRDLIKLSPKPNRRSDNAGLETQKLLPCEARLCLRQASSAIARIKANAQTQERRIQAGDDALYDVRCDSFRHADYLLQLSCPEEIQRPPLGSVVVPISVNILARDFDSLYPGMELGDDRLHISIENGEVVLSNITSDYLSVTAQTVYYNSKVQTNAGDVSLAPGAIVRQSIEQLVSPAINIESNYLQMTPDKANGTTFEFGFAVKYSNAGESSDTTLYDKREFNVGCVIDNTMQPGSCDQRRIGDVQVSEYSVDPF